jgi:hypothetical protein
MRSRRRRGGTWRRRAWTRIKRLVGRGGPGAEPPPDWSDEEPALVPVGPPRRPQPSSSIALDLPEPDNDVDAYGRTPA